MQENISLVVENGIKYSVLITPQGNEMWFEFEHAGRYHRELGPAIIYYNGSTMWFTHGKKNRVGAPAVEWSNGKKEHWIDGKLHKLDGPAKYGLDIEDNQYWFNGKLFNVNNQKDFELQIKLLILK